jgi:hypothetical protein
MFMVAEMRKEKLRTRSRNVAGRSDSGQLQIRRFQKDITF